MPTDMRFVLINCSRSTAVFAAVPTAGPTDTSTVDLVNHDEIKHVTLDFRG